MGKKIAVIGAGPKAAALVALAATMKTVKNGPMPPEIIVIDRNGVGSAWTGEDGFSSGYLTLCTPGEKDVGFPYSSFEPVIGAEEAIASKLFARFSWPAFLIAQAYYGEWVERGRDHPTHYGWASYLKWVFHQAEQPDPMPAEITARSIRRHNKKWRIADAAMEDGKPLIVDGVVLTGTGPAKAVKIGANIPVNRVLDAETFWKSRNSLPVRTGQGIAVAGTGGAAATILAWLVQHYAETETPIYSIGGSGTLFPRGDGYSERRWFSGTDIDAWQRLTVDHRNEIINRTEAGVVSGRYKSILDRATHLHSRPGHVRAVNWAASNASDEPSSLEISVEYNGVNGVFDDADVLINATGFDQWRLLEPVNHRVAGALLKSDNKTKNRRLTKQMQIGPDLSIPGLPGIHVPALASLQQGPGMGNLGSLGTMAEAIIKTYQT